MIQKTALGQLEPVSHHFPNYHMKILLGNFNAKVVRENRVYIRIVMITVLE